MFTHQGKKRTVSHNLQIASLLSFVAGIVNIAGFLAVQRLTTNVTGHFAFFVDEIFKLNFWEGFVYFLYILSFFMGSFSSSFLVEFVSRRNGNYVYVVPTSVEVLILSIVALYGGTLVFEYPNLLACSLLFAMGLQNSLVTRISNATVRTTHLTGLFTDLGIELSQLLFYKEVSARQKLFTAIKLRLTIISFFFIGGIVGGIFYSQIGLHVLFIGVAVLISGLAYDSFRLKLLLFRRKHKF